MNIYFKKELQALELLKDGKNHTNKEIGVHLNITTTIMGRIAKTLLFRKLIERDAKKRNYSYWITAKGLEHCRMGKKIE